MIDTEKLSVALKMLAEAFLDIADAIAAPAEAAPDHEPDTYTQDQHQ